MFFFIFIFYSYILTLSIAFWIFNVAEKYFRIETKFRGALIPVMFASSSSEINQRLLSSTLTQYCIIKGQQAELKWWLHIATDLFHLQDLCISINIEHILQLTYRQSNKPSPYFKEDPASFSNHRQQPLKGNHTDFFFFFLANQSLFAGILTAYVWDIKKEAMSDPINCLKWWLLMSV